MREFFNAQDRSEKMFGIFCIVGAAVALFLGSFF